MTEDVRRWRPLVQADLTALDEIARRVHPDHPEDTAIFAERLALFPRGCFMFAGARPEGYLLSHPWVSRRAPRLNTLLRALPARPDTYYIHDIALIDSSRGFGAGAAAIEMIVALATSEGLPGLSLVTLKKSMPFWTRFGFTPLDDAALAGDLATYGADARFLTRSI